MMQEKNAISIVFKKDTGWLYSGNIHCKRNDLAGLILLMRKVTRDLETTYNTGMQEIKKE